jgi:hypothetical protein
MLHIITPFSRPNNIPALLDNIATSKLAEYIHWHPLIHEEVEFPSLKWIHPMMIKYPKRCEQDGTVCYQKMNTFMDNGLIDNDFYCVLCDDDLYAPNFHEEISKHHGEIVVPSMKLPSGEVLNATPENMRVSRVGFEQLIIRGSIFKTRRYIDSYCADGDMIECLYRDYSFKFEFAPEAVVLFNALR